MIVGMVKEAILMAKSFTFPLTVSPDSLLAKAKAVAQEGGVSFVGDTTGGRFEGKGVQGEYRVEGTHVTVTILSKPFLAPWSVIEAKVRAFFA